MSAGNQRQFISLAPRILVVLGLVLIVSVLLDYLILLYPPNLDNYLDPQWRLSYGSELVDRGIVPLVGIALLFAGIWSANQAQSRANRSLLQLPVKIPALILASILGLIFLLAIASQLKDSASVRSQRLTQIADQAQAAETRLSETLDSQVEQERNRVSVLLENEQLLDQAISSGDIDLQQATLLQQFKDQPGSLDVYLNQQAEELRKRALEEIQTQKAQLAQQAQQTTWIAGVRAALNSFLLMLAFTSISWLGLRQRKVLLGSVPNILVIAGGGLTLFSLVDYGVLLWSRNGQGLQWQLNFMTQLVGSGIIPLVGLTLVFVGLWSSRFGQTESSPARSLRLPLGVPAGVLAAFLSLVFLVVIPLYGNDVRTDRAEKLAAIAQTTQAQKDQLEQSLQAQVQQQRNQVLSVIQNPQQLEQAISSGRIPPEQANLFRGFADEPGTLDQFLTAQADEFRQQALKDIEKNQADNEKNVKRSALQSGLRIGVGSLFLFIGHALLAWTGFISLRP